MQKYIILMSALLMSSILVACGGAPGTSTTAPQNAPTTASEKSDVADTNATSAITATHTMSNTATSGGVYTIVPNESHVSYSVGEVFLNEGNKFVTAVGITQQLEGSVTFDAAHPQQSSVGTITIDISAFTSDSNRRDNAIRERWLESTTYPMATFEPTKIDGLPETYTDGEEVTLSITGDLTVREVTVPTTFETVGTMNGNEMRGTATTTLQMTSFGFNPPDIAGILKAENDVLVTFDFVARAE
jgi:polyisoprenoid-binding protein YceI